MNPLSGWGIGPYGLSPYGSGAVGAGAISATGFYIENAVMLSTHELLVTFSMPFLYSTVVNPNSWDIRDDTRGVQIGVYGTQPLNLTQVIVVLTEPAAPFANEFSVGGDILSSTNLVLDPPRASFFGVNLPPTSLGTQQRDFDLANPFITPDGKGGTLSIASGGDYNVESGRDLVLKLVVRRLVATPRDFIFYPDSYGVGLKVNTPIYLTDLARLRIQVQQSLEQEPELEAVQVSVTLNPATSILNLGIRGRLKRSGAPFSIDVPIDTASVSFT